MLFGFEGTGMQMHPGTSEVALNDLSGTSSFVWRFTQYSTEDSSVVKYFPGPNAQGSNCDDILEQAIKHYEYLDSENKAHKINLVGYSRGAYLAMCFARYLDKKKYKKVNFMALFDAVSRDETVEHEYRSLTVPLNVNNCYHAARSPRIGSRKYSMNRAGQMYDWGQKPLDYRLYPGSHAAMGGFPMAWGTADSPVPEEQGDPQNRGWFHINKEFTASWEASQFISGVAMQHKVINRSLMNKPAHVPLLPPDKDWYTPNLKVVRRNR